MFEKLMWPNGKVREEREARKAASSTSPTGFNASNLTIDPSGIKSAMTDTDHHTLEGAALKVMRPMLVGVDANGTIYTIDQIVELQQRNPFQLAVTWKMVWAKAEDGTVISGLTDPSPELAAYCLQELVTKNPQLFRLFNGGIPTLQSPAALTSPQPAAPASTNDKEDSSTSEDGKTDFVRPVLRELGYAEEVQLGQLNAQQLQVVQKRVAEREAEHEKAKKADELRLGLSLTMAAAADRILDWTPKQQEQYRRLAEMIGRIEDPESLAGLIELIDMSTRIDVLKSGENLTDKARSYLAFLGPVYQWIFAVICGNPDALAIMEHVNKLNKSGTTP